MRQAKRRFLFLMIGLILVSFAGCRESTGSSNSQNSTVNTESHSNLGSAIHQVSEEIRKEFPAERVNSLRVLNQVGSVEIAPAGEGVDTVDIDAKKVVQGSPSEAELKPYLSKVQMSARIEGDVLLVESNTSSNLLPKDASAQVHYVITVPGRFVVDLHTSNSPVTARGVVGGVTVLTTNGAVELHEVGGILDVTNSNGPITLSESTVGEQITLVTSNGEINCDDIHAANRALKVALTSTNAPIHFAGDASELKLQTSNGEIEVEPTNRLTFENGALITINAPITLTLPHSFSASIQAKTSNASIHASGISDSGTDTNQDTSRTIAVGSQHAPIQIETSNGEINIVIKHE